MSRNKKQQYFSKQFPTLFKFLIFSISVIWKRLKELIEFWLTRTCNTLVFDFSDSNIKVICDFETVYNLFSLDCTKAFHCRQIPGQLAETAGVPEWKIRGTDPEVCEGTGGPWVEPRPLPHPVWPDQSLCGQILRLGRPG